MSLTSTTCQSFSHDTAILRARARRQRSGPGPHSVFTPPHASVWLYVTGRRKARQLGSAAAATVGPSNVLRRSLIFARSNSIQWARNRLHRCFKALFMVNRGPDGLGPQRATSWGKSQPNSSVSASCEHPCIVDTLLEV